ALALGFGQIGAADVARVGGKAANLGELTRAGVTVPPGFCVTTGAFDAFIAALPGAEGLYAALDALDGASPEAAREAATAMRAALDRLSVPSAVGAEVT